MACWIFSSRRFLILACVCLFVQLCCLYYLFNSLNEHQNLNDVAQDIESLSEVASKRNLHFHLFDAKLLNQIENDRLLIAEDVHEGRTLLLACDSRYLKGRKLFRVLNDLRRAGFDGHVFYNEKPDLTTYNVTHDVPIAIIAKRIVIFCILLLHTKEGNTWWFGSVSNDPFISNKLSSLSLSNTNNNILSLFLQEGILNKFESSRLIVNSCCNRFLRPTNITKFISDLKASRFIECNFERAKSFMELHGIDNNIESLRFRHKAWKLLSKVKTVLDSNAIPFWISSGTCLGYFRECNIISHSKDVDIGIFIRDFTENIINYLESQHINLKFWFGEVEDSLELSFIDQSNTKLDIFFFYEENDIMWNGGTQARTGKKFKYIFPKFELCWTLFLGLKLRIPCDTETYIRANYGPYWNVPVVDWDWKNSPYNVMDNGIWPKNKLNLVIRRY